MAHIITGCYFQWVISLLTAILGGAAVSNAPAATISGIETSRVAAVSASADDAEKELEKLMEADDEAQAEVDDWIRQNDEFARRGAATPPAQMRAKIQQRFEPVRKAYEEFIQRHPRNSKARIAYASFLGDTKDEDSALDQLEQALTVDTNNPAIYNNLANIYGHIGPVKKAFEYYAKAIQLNPLEPVYYHNLGTTVYLFRTDAKEFYGIDEAHVFAKAFQLYSNAMRLDPMNFPLASDVAQSYYGMKPMHTEEALHAWTNALQIAHDEIEREGVYLHFARIKLMAGRYTEAQAHINTVTNDMYTDLKRRLQRNLNERQNGAKSTNAPPVQ